MMMSFQIFCPDGAHKQNVQKAGTLTIQVYPLTQGGKKSHYWKYEDYIKQLLKSSYLFISMSNVCSMSFSYIELKNPTHVQS